MKLQGHSPQNHPHFWYQLKIWSVPKTNLSISNSLKTHSTHWRQSHPGYRLLQLRRQTEFDPGKPMGQSTGMFLAWSPQVSSSQGTWTLLLSQPWCVSASMQYCLGAEFWGLRLTAPIADLSPVELALCGRLSNVNQAPQANKNTPISRAVPRL